jgi:hypothetical protein
MEGHADVTWLSPCRRTQIYVHVQRRTDHASRAHLLGARLVNPAAGTHRHARQ